MVHQPALSALLGPIALLTPVPAQSVAQAASHLDQPLPAQHVRVGPSMVSQVTWGLFGRLHFVDEPLH